MPILPRESPEDVVVLSVELNVVSVKILKQIVRSENLCNLHQLIGIAVPVEEGLLSKDHRSEHGSQRPHVERVIVFLKIDQ